MSPGKAVSLSYCLQGRRSACPGVSRGGGRPVLLSPGTAVSLSCCLQGQRSACPAVIRAVVSLSCCLQGRPVLLSPGTAVSLSCCHQGSGQPVLLSSEAACPAVSRGGGQPVLLSPGAAGGLSCCLQGQQAACPAVSRGSRRPVLLSPGAAVSLSCCLQGPSVLLSPGSCCHCCVVFVWVGRAGPVECHHHMSVSVVAVMCHVFGLSCSQRLVSLRRSRRASSLSTSFARVGEEPGKRAHFVCFARYSRVRVRRVLLPRSCFSISLALSLLFCMPPLYVLCNMSAVCRVAPLRGSCHGPAAEPEPASHRLPPRQRLSLTSRENIFYDCCSPPVDWAGEGRADVGGRVASECVSGGSGCSSLRGTTGRWRHLRAGGMGVLRRLDGAPRRRRPVLSALRRTYPLPSPRRLAVAEAYVYSAVLAGRCVCANADVVWWWSCGADNGRGTGVLYLRSPAAAVAVCLPAAVAGPGSRRSAVTASLSHRLTQRRPSPPPPCDVTVTSAAPSPTPLNHAG